MNHVFLIGNGFDRNLKLKTSYLDFYDYYFECEDPEDEIVRSLRESIKIDKKKWSDLELRLGKYAKNINSYNELQSAIFDLVYHLRKYLENIEESTDYSKYSGKLLLNDLVNPERVLSAKHQKEIREFKAKFSGNQVVQIEILSFNYTKTIERVLENKYRKVEISKSANQRFVLRGIEHIHGYINERLILGVNDVAQIANEELRDNQEYVELLSKPQHNEQLGHLRDVYCLQRISQATMIYVFGSSIGETDKLWWEAIGRRVGQNCCLVIFYRAKYTDGNELLLEIHRGREVVNRFLSLSDLDENQKSNARKYIFASTTKDLFKLGVSST